jgi:hypothetical protein
MKRAHARFDSGGENAHIERCSGNPLLERSREYVAFA